MQRPSNPPEQKKARKLVVLDMDALFHPPDSTNSATPIHEAALQKLINYAKENDQVHLIFISDKYNDNEIRQLIEALIVNAGSFTQQGFDIKIHHGPSLDYISQHCEAAYIPPENVIWVDVKTNKLKEAAAKQYMPILALRYKDENSQPVYPSSSYLDFIPMFLSHSERPNEVARTAVTLVTSIYPTEKEKCNTLMGFYESVMLPKIEERIRPADKVRSVAKPLSKFEFEELKKEFSEGKFRKLLNTRADVIITNINRVKSFEELQSVYKLVQQEKAVAKTEMGLGKITGKEGATNRWQHIATALQEKALEIARKDIGSNFPEHHPTYEAIFSLKVYRGLFSQSSIKEEYKKLIHAWKHHHFPAPK